jgi:2-keto-4-pentenoate hydratase
MTTMNNTTEVADLLAQAWSTQEPLAELPSGCRPASLREAYACQAALIERLAPEYGAPVGYKIGCTSEWAQNLLGVDAPFYGRLLSKRVYRSPAQVPLGDFSLCIIEPEFAFKMAADLPPEGAPYEESDVIAAIGTLLPAFEIVDSRFRTWTTVGALSLIADNGSNGAWVAGEDYAGDWRTLDLAEHVMELHVNGAVVRQGSGEKVMGNPLHALIWLVKTLNQQGYGLKAGELVSTGVCCEVYQAVAGDRLRADFADLGTVELTFR